jgi:uncharacterized membrane protein YdjX (TVP38/TMEM64 family)
MTPARRIRHGIVQHWRRLLGAVVALGVAVLVVSSGELHAAITGAFAAARGIIATYPVAGMALFVLLAALSAMVAFFSSAVLVPVGVLAWGTAGTFALLWLGWFLGGVAAYAIGRHFGRRVLLWVVRDESLQRYERRLARHAPFPVLVLLQMALPSEVPGYLVGVMRYPFGRYVAALAVAELPFALGAVLLGDSFIRGDTLRLVAVGLVGILLSVSAVLAWQQRTGPATR